MDADMVVKADIAELFFKFEADVAMMIEQHEFEWASLMVFNCDRCKILTPEFIDERKNVLFDRQWARSVASLPTEWNHCVGYAEPKEAKLYHYTQGIPIWPETRGLEDEPFMNEAQKMLKSVSWQELMGNSVHAEHVRKRNADLAAVS